MSARGIFMTFEGVEGSGKSTQVELLARDLTDLGFNVVVLREPGGTEIGERVRRILLDPAICGMSAQAELLLYQASRAQLVAERIMPALATGSVVLCDRFTDSTLAYQGFGRGLSADDITELSRIATAGLVPHLTFVLDIDAAVGLARAVTDGPDRLEAEEIAFHERVHEGFRVIAKGDPDRVVLVDANGTPEEVHQKVLAESRRLPLIEVMLTRSGR